MKTKPKTLITIPRLPTLMLLRVPMCDRPLVNKRSRVPRDNKPDLMINWQEDIASPVTASRLRLSPRYRAFKKKLAPRRYVNYGILKTNWEFHGKL